MCYTAPTFEGTGYVHDYNCYRYYLPAIFVDDPVVMQVKVPENNLTFKWWKDHHESIDCTFGQACKYILTNNNMARYVISEHMICTKLRNIVVFHSDNISHLYSTYHHSWLACVM